MKIKILALVALLTTFVAGASGPEYDFWFNYGARPLYDPDQQSREIQQKLYRGSLIEQQVPKQAHLSGLTNLQQRLSSITALMKKQGRPFIFNEQDHSYGSNKAAIEHKGHRFVVEFALRNGRSFSWGKCSSNSIENVLLLIEQTSKLANVDDNELRQLIELRLQVYNQCGQGKLSKINIDAGLLSKAHFRYVAAIIDFYQHKFATAIAHFEQIAHQDNGWFGETAHYLIARSYFAQAQRHWSGSAYDRSSIDNKVLKVATDKLVAYRQVYPQGHYVMSSRGLTRKSYVHTGDFDQHQLALIDDFQFIAGQMAEKSTFSQADIKELQGFIREFDSQDGEQYAGINVLLAIQQQMHSEQLFTHPFYVFLTRLKKFTTAHGLYQKGEYQSVIDIMITIDQQSLALQTLLARAHQKLGQFEQSIAFWQQVKDKRRVRLVQTEIAKSLFYQGGLPALLNTEQPLADEVFALALARACSAAQVAKVLPKVMQPQRKHWVVYDLAVRYLETDNIAQLYQLFKTQPDSVLKELALIRTAVTMVATGSDSAKGYMNIAYFMENKIRRPAFAQHYINNYSPTDLLTGECKQSYLREDTRDPYYYYQKALTFIDEASEIEAKTLHFLVYCHKPQGVLKDCRWQKYVRNDQGRTTPLSNTSEQWFQTLHRKYKDSPWAVKTPYYFK